MTVTRWLVFTVLCYCTLCRAQDTEFLPEIDAHLTLDQRVRFLVQSKDDREGGDPQQFTSWGIQSSWWLKVE